MEWYDTNNFYCYLPGGRYRRGPRNTNTRKLMVDLDKLIKETGFDATSVLEQMIKGVRMVITASDGVKVESSREQAVALGNEGDSLMIEAQKRLFPLYEAMLRKGYDRKTLIT